MELRIHSGSARNKGGSGLATSISSGGILVGMSPVNLWDLTLTPGSVKIELLDTPLVRGELEN